MTFVGEDVDYRIVRRSPGDGEQDSENSATSFLRDHEFVDAAGHVAP
jgi:hypothetical protein